MRKILLVMIGLSVGLMADFVRDVNTSIVSDSTTGLQWQDDAVGSTMAWQSAIDTCENLTLGGQSDWRLPNINELKTIIDRSRVNPAIASVFTQTSSDVYWSSTTYEGLKDGAWVVYFDGGYVDGNGKDDNDYVRCVRAGQ
ncbi:MAG: DUF1566 domain-containing protein [Sulfurimonas sp.]|nr:DUF1566 domain-containing protein [Sulfurimonas sp.]